MRVLRDICKFTILRPGIELDADVFYRSVRDPILTDHFWLNPLSQHFSQISVSDLILVNEDGDVVIGDEPINAAAFAIHSESKSLC
jgi:hypothetical protein